MSKLSDETRNRLVAALLGNDKPAAPRENSLAALARRFPEPAPRSALEDYAMSNPLTGLAALASNPFAGITPNLGGGATLADLRDTSWMTDEERVDAVWRRGHPIAFYDPAVWRTDDYGTVLRRRDHGKNSEYGWHIDHIVAKAFGGTDHLGNLRPLHCKTNMSLGGALGAYLRE